MNYSTFKFNSETLPAVETTADFSPTLPRNRC